MKRLSTGVLALLIAAGLGLSAVAAPTSGSQGNIGTNAIAQAGGTAEAPPANFGSPPSGQIPILYNDHHVYSKPDTLKQGRVLAALVKGGTVLIPLRSMFEQMGAAVSYDAGSKTVTVSKPGAEVKVTVGKPEVIINGESRPLDVPPIIWQGSVLVPVRVISEGMGAYVLWVPDKQLVVVRYLPPTPPPAPVETEAPVVSTPPPTPTPAPVKTPYQDKWIAGDYILSPSVYNEFSAGYSNDHNDGFSAQVTGGFEFTALNLPWMLEGNYRSIAYQHEQDMPTTPQAGGNLGNECDGIGGDAPVTGEPGCVTAIGGGFNTFVPAFTVRNYDFDARLALRVLNPRVYIGVGYLFRNNNAGYPTLRALGYGAEKLPDLDKTLSVYGSAWYYPDLKDGNTVIPLEYSYLKYDIGVDWAVQGSPLFISLGFMGDQAKNKENAPDGETANGAYVGLGLKF